MEDSEDDAGHQRPHRIKRYWQNPLKISLLVYYSVFYEARYKGIAAILVQTCGPEASKLRYTDTATY